MQNKKISMEKVKPMYEQFKGWAGEFMLATTEQKKMIISQVTSHIEISKGYRIKIEMNLDYKQFCEGWEELNGKDIRIEKG